MKSVRIKALTWMKESSGLYDYESREIFKNTLRACESSVLFLQNSTISLQNESEYNENSKKLIKPLIKLIKNKGIL